MQRGARYTSVVEIGRIPVALSSSSESFNETLRQRYSGFLSSSRPEFQLDFELTENRVITDAEIRVRRDAEEWTIERGDFQARWNPQTGRGVVEQNSNPYSADAVLRIVLSLVLASRGGFLLHGASAVCRGRAYAFSGVSGAGKTTISRLAPAEVTLLTDEISFIRPRADGYSAYGTPFAGELAKAGENCSAPVGALFFLEKSPDNRVEELPAAEAAQRLLRNILFFAEDPDLVGTMLNTACDFVSRVPIRRLLFYPDGKVWNTVRDFQGDPTYA